jgi:hypothetical protein
MWAASRLPLQRLPPSRLPTNAPAAYPSTAAVVCVFQLNIPIFTLLSSHTTLNYLIETRAKSSMICKQSKLITPTLIDFCWPIDPVRSGLVSIWLISSFTINKTPFKVHTFFYIITVKKGKKPFGVFIPQVSPNFLTYSSFLILKSLTNEAAGILN